MATAGYPAHTNGLPVPGDVLGGKYEIVRLLGEGGMASVFEASHRRLEQRVAIKLLSPEFATDAELVARFEREARAMGKLTTKHVVRVIDVEETPAGLPYMVMELLAGRDVDAEIQARGRLPLGEAVDIILQACSGMLEAHAEGIVHRDLKPANLFLVEDRDTRERVVKIIDFGISKVASEDAKLTSVGAVMGTVLYMSPEQVRGESNVDQRADVWSIGVILYELLAGRAPFSGSSQQIATQIVSQDAPELRTHVTVPEDVAFGVRRMLERDRARRFRSLDEVITALAPFAPPDSVGADIARQQSIGAAGTRGKTVVLAAKHTVPFATHPRPADRSPSYNGVVSRVVSRSVPPLGHPLPSVPPPRAEVSDHGRHPGESSDHARWVGEGSDHGRRSGELSDHARRSGELSDHARRGDVRSVSHTVAPAAPRSSRSLLVFAIVVGLLGAIGVVLIGVVLARRAPATGGDPAPSGEHAAIPPAAVDVPAPSAPPAPGAASSASAPPALSARPDTAVPPTSATAPSSGKPRAGGTSSARHGAAPRAPGPASTANTPTDVPSHL